MLLASCLLLSLTGALAQKTECLSRDYNHGGTVCVCNSDYCDTIPRPTKLDQSSYHVYTSNRAGLRFDLKTNQFTDGAASTNQITINRKEKLQEVLGWGGAFTDSTGINIGSLDANLQDKILSAYFSEDGLEYSLCRVPIGGTDFSVRGYSYDDGDVDIDLVNFKLAPEDFDYKIPYIKRAVNLTGGNLRFFASAWTAPKWMKTNGQYNGYGFLIKDMYQAWANYFVKFLDQYQEQGIEFWGITTGNEPSLVDVPAENINSVGWLSGDLGDWILSNLGPTMKSSKHSALKIMILDDQRLFLPWYVREALKDNTTRQYIDGIAVHWYLNIVFPASLITDTHDIFPEKFFLATEASNGAEIEDFTLSPVILGAWHRGENYSIDIIEDLLNWVGGWVDWNMVLDLAGGPTYIGNTLDAPIIINATAGEFYKQPMYYHLGHFTKFIPRGSVRIAATSLRDSNVMSVAFERPDEGVVVVILNRKEEVVSVTIVDDLRGEATVALSEKSITTILYW